MSEKKEPSGHEGGIPVIPERMEPPGEPETFEEIFARYYPSVVHDLIFLLGNGSAAEDVAQETFIKFFISPPPRRENLGGWLKTVARRLALNLLRGEKRLAGREARASLPDPSRVVPLEEVVLRHEEVGQVRYALEALPERDRLALLMRHAGCRYQEIADLLVLPSSSVGSVLARAEKKFLAAYYRMEGGD